MNAEQKQILERLAAEDLNAAEAQPSPAKAEDAPDREATSDTGKNEPPPAGHASGWYRGITVA